jgi:hypothetical protein
MSQSDIQPPKSDRTLWFVAGAILVVALLAGGYFLQTMRLRNAAGTATLSHAEQLARAELAVCQAEMLTAKNLGIVPVYAQLASQKLLRTAGSHYICVAGTHLTRYYILADLRCNKLPQCIQVERVAVKDGPLVYLRPQ